jgi:hypothetical protein
MKNLNTNIITQNTTIIRPCGQAYTWYSDKGVFNKNESL